MSRKQLDSEGDYDRLFERLRKHTGAPTDVIEQIARKLAMRVDAENERRIAEVFQSFAAEHKWFKSNAERRIVRGRSRWLFTAVDLLVAKSMISILAAKDLSEKPEIIIPPGGWMQALAGTIFPKKTKEEIFDQIVACASARSGCCLQRVMVSSKTSRSACRRSCLCSLRSRNPTDDAGPDFIFIFSVPVTGIAIGSALARQFFLGYREFVGLAGLDHEFALFLFPDAA